MDEILKTKIEEEPMVMELASRFHENWRHARDKTQDGLVEPDFEVTTDQYWIDQHDGNNVVDIANTDFIDLPADFRKENVEAAKVAWGLLADELIEGVDFRTDEFIEESADKIHQEWLKRNPDDENIAELSVPYQALSEDQKAKDRDQILAAIDLYLESSPELALSA